MDIPRDRDPDETHIKPAPEARILLIEDDTRMQHVFSEYFESHGVNVTCAVDRVSANEHLAQMHIDLIVLDLRLGSENGLEILRELRTRSNIPIIIATGHRLEEIDRVIGLELGADDYILKPYGLRELLARIRGILRRVEIFTAANAQPKAMHRNFFAGWVLDRPMRRLTKPDGTEVPLTKSEYALLIAFLDSPQKVLSRDQLLQATRVHEDVFDRSIDVQILRLRRKMETDPGSPKMIVTERGMGYIFTPSVRTSQGEHLPQPRGLRRFVV